MHIHKFKLFTISLFISFTFGLQEDSELLPSTPKVFDGCQHLIFGHNTLADESRSLLHFPTMSKASKVTAVQQFLRMQTPKGTKKYANRMAASKLRRILECLGENHVQILDLYERAIFKVSGYRSPPSDKYRTNMPNPMDVEDAKLSAYFSSLRSNLDPRKSPNEPVSYSEYLQAALYARDPQTGEFIEDDARDIVINRKKFKPLQKACKGVKCRIARILVHIDQLQYSLAQAAIDNVQNTEIGNENTATYIEWLEVNNLILDARKIIDLEKRLATPKAIELIVDLANVVNPQSSGIHSGDEEVLKYVKKVRLLNNYYFPALNFADHCRYVKDKIANYCRPYHDQLNSLCSMIKFQIGDQIDILIDGLQLEKPRDRKRARNLFMDFIKMSRLIPISEEDQDRLL